jgi:hypothetical protein
MRTAARALGNAVEADIGVLASAATIVPIKGFNRITGDTTINTITRPDAYFTGPIYLFNTDESVGTISTDGNVALGVTLTRYKVFTLIYDPVTSKWYPSAAS